MKINDPDDDPIIGSPINDNDEATLERIAKDLGKYNRPFMLAFDLGNNKIKCIGNVNDFPHGELYMADMLEAIAASLRKRYNEN